MYRESVPSGGIQGGVISLPSLCDVCRKAFVWYCETHGLFAATQAFDDLCDASRLQWLCLRDIEAGGDFDLDDCLYAIGAIDHDLFAGADAPHDCCEVPRRLLLRDVDNAGHNPIIMPRQWLAGAKCTWVRVTLYNSPMALFHLIVPAVLLCAMVPLLPAAAQVSGSLPAALTTDPQPDAKHPATMETFQLPSHGEMLNALAYIAQGAGPHPTVLLLHGFPGNERNLDLAQTLRRAGYNVVYFNYRGAWGSPGTFSFTHAIEDAQAAVAYLREPANAAKLRANPGEIILMGHSMGGMIASVVGAKDPGIRAVVLISAADMAGRTLPTVESGHQKLALPVVAKALAAEGIAPLAGCTATSLAEDLLAHAAAWAIPAQAAGLATPRQRPILVISSDDGLAPATDALVQNLRKIGDTHVTAVHLATDHVYSDHRIALEASILNWLQSF